MLIFLPYQNNMGGLSANVGIFFYVKLKRDGEVPIVEIFLILK